MKIIAFALALVCCLPMSSQAQTADEIITKHLEATGATASYPKIKSMRTEAKIQQGPGVEFPMNMTVIDNQAMLMDITVANMVIKMALNKDKGWKVDPMQGKTDAEPLSPEEVTMMQDQLVLSGDLYNYAAKGNSVELIGTDDMEGTEVYKIKVTRKNGNVAYHFIDKESFYDLKQTDVYQIEGKDVEGSTTFSNFQKTEMGLILPYEINGGMGVIKIEKVEINPTIDEKMFEMPAPKPVATEAGK